MKSIAFSYTDSRGHTTDWELLEWRESGRYLQGTAKVDGKFRTFRKDRINRYLGEGETALSEPYVPAPPTLDSRPEIAFTGFPKSKRAELEAFASEHGMRVRKSVTQDLVFLCCGANAGPSKVQAARDQGCFILDEAALTAMVETGEIEDEPAIGAKITRGTE